MRIIGHLPSEASATTFSDYLYVQGISNVVEPEQKGWAVWIHSEDELERAREFLAGFLGNPADPKFQNQGREAAARKARQEVTDQAAEKRVFDRSRLFRSSGGYAVGAVSVALIFACVVVAALSHLGDDPKRVESLFITKFEIVGGRYLKYAKLLPELRQGEVWRLFTPALLHFGFLHLFFNMLWLLDLGSMVEARQGRWCFARLVLVIAGVSNFAEFLVTGPRFGGMSGVVYGLLGYIWVKGKRDPGSGLFLHSQTALMMLIYFFLCLLKVIPNIANTVHAVGLILGLAWGFFSSLRANRSAS